VGTTNGYQATHLGSRRPYAVVGTLAKLLETRFEIVGTAANSKELLEAAATLKPHLVILDRRLQDAGDQLRELLPNAKQIVLAMDDGDAISIGSEKLTVSGVATSGAV
jgi:DNA-binding NarL/FixJ family response regulator